MKTNQLQGAIAALVVLAGTIRSASADPYIDSWFTANSGKYARLYTTDAAKSAGTAATTWSNGSQTQSLPAYAGVQEIYSSTSWVYIRSTGLGSHVMGPWYLDAGHAQAFPNYPVNQKVFYRFPRTPSVPASKTLTALGAIGYFVDGIAMFDSRDGFVWTGSAESGSGTGYWNREAYVNEGVTFDPGYAHQEQTGQHHYHANPIALRYLLGDHVDFNSATKTYSESTNVVAKHSPILGWVRDGFPVYGPYGYASASNSASGIRRMVSGYVLRNGQNGTQNLTLVGRTNIPQWAVRVYGVAAAQTGPTVSTTYPLGRYMEDNDYLGDLGKVQGVDFDLDEYNGRWCVTPEFPGGTYAYFVSISSNGVPTYPYNIGRAFYGSPNGASVTTLAETVTTNFLGGPKASALLNRPAAKNNVVTLTWSAVEGGTYRVESSTNLTTWTTNATGLAASLNSGAYTNNSADAQRFYRVAMTDLAAYDPVSGTSGTGGTTFAVPGGSVSRGSGTNITLTITLPGTPPSPPANAPITSVTMGSLTAVSTSYQTSGTVLATFNIPANATLGAQTVTVQFSIPSFQFVNGFTINP
ncbi:MAG: YHYH protein [Verrucomicrobiota bacterium]